MPLRLGRLVRPWRSYAAAGHSTTVERGTRSYREAPLRGEQAFLDRLRSRLPSARSREVWVGDDTAVLDGGLLLATDALVEGVHFDLAHTRPAEVGWKALAVNLSDVAAMGGRPRAAVLALAVPPDRPGLADEVVDGVAEAAGAFGCPLVGGDTTGGPVLMVSVAVLGEAPPSGPVLRSGARAGDAVLVTGALGGARRAFEELSDGRVPRPGLAARLHRPRPKLAEGAAAAAGGASAMIDLSDGLGIDVGRLCAESGVGVRIDAALVPVAEGASLEDALAGGDDYELCFTAGDVPVVADAFAGAGLDAPTVIGEIVEGPECRVVMPDRSVRDLPAGWEHAVP